MQRLSRLHSLISAAAVTGLIVTALIASVGQPATATSPGQNGSIVVSAGSEAHLWSGRPDGTESRQLTSGSATDGCPAVSGSGSLIGFCRRNDAGGFDLWVMNADGSNPRQLTDFPEEPLSAASDPTFSSSMPRVAFVFVSDFLFNSAGISYDIRSVRSDGTGVKRLTRSPAWNDFSPVFSPDGHRLLWVRTGATQQNSGRTQLWIMRANGEDKRMVRSDINWGQRADWNPAGQRIVYPSGRVLKIVSTDGTHERRIAIGKRANDPVWSPNGRWIAYRTGSRIELVSIDGGTTRSVTPFWGEDGGPLGDHFSWQPLPQ